MSNNQASKGEQGMDRYFFRTSAENFKKITGKPIAYWVSEKILNSYGKTTLNDFADPRQGFATGDNARFLRFWHEVNFFRIKLNATHWTEVGNFSKKWVPCNKGGSFRRWYGNNNYVVAFDPENFDALSKMGNHLPSRDFYFRPGWSWSTISSGLSSYRYSPEGFVFETKGSVCFPRKMENMLFLGAFLNSSLLIQFLSSISPTLDFHEGPLRSVPFLYLKKDFGYIHAAVNSSKNDWDSYEVSWDFTSLPLLHPEYRQPTINSSYQKLRAQWRDVTLEMQRLEEENNRIFIDAYGLQDELTPAVPLNEITLTCNPHYRYGGDKTEAELEAMLLADTMRELVSYAVGCMLGRYSLDKPGLILANQGETLADYLAQVPQPSFPADDDNVIPVLDGDWFADDITLRFRQFLRVAFGDAHYDENLAFIEQALNVKGKRNYSLRDYFLSEFYADHVKRYKKRPIYWLFSSPKGSFNALIYMHRYRPDTVSVVLKYLRDYREKLVTEKERQAAVSINPASSQGEKTKALKEVDRLAKVLAELEDYERDVLYPLATEQKQIDLDDGVKVNYLKFGAALKKIAGLEAKDED